MGQEQSSIVGEDTPPQTLKARTIDGVADHIKSGQAKRIVVMTGAGISTSAGIPDFRSPDTGLYANLARLNLPYAEAVFDISYFRNNPLPFYTLAHELYPGKFRPTPAHAFVALLHRKNLLLKLFTQNIDCLERAAGVPDHLIVEAHGSFAHQRCIECRTELSDEAMKAAISSREVPYCSRAPECKGLVKPDIVFFGEQLPSAFFESRHLAGEADLCIIMGTSLSVQPFASLPAYAGEGVPRLLLNKERVGGLGGRADDVLLLGECDDGVRQLADALGWREELEELWRESALQQGKWEQNGTGSYTETTNGAAHPTAKSKDEILEAEIRKLTADVDRSLQVSGEHTTRVRDQLEKENARFPWAEERSQYSPCTQGDDSASTEALSFKEVVAEMEAEEKEKERERRNTDAKNDVASAKCQEKEQTQDVGVASERERANPDLATLQPAPAASEKAAEQNDSP